eukprot:2851128-Karenia_brevis.AAC.1
MRAEGLPHNGGSCSAAQGHASPDGTDVMATDPGKISFNAAISACEVSGVNFLNETPGQDGQWQ